MANLYVAVVCSSNMNRSMEAHAFMARKGLKVKSFGTGDKVRLPGASANRPNCYEFGVPYNDIYNDLVAKDMTYYTRNGILHMLNRNRRIKPCPERFQDCNDRFDVIITCEKRVYDRVIEWFGSRRSIHNQSVHVVNIDIEDNQEEAILGAFLISDMVSKMAHSDNLDNDIDEIIHDFELKFVTLIRNCIMFY